jgi:hypothetical protein
MIDERVINYIKNARLTGINNTQIITDLKSGGWNDQVISEAFGIVNGVNTIPVNPVQNQPISPQPVQPQVQNITKSVHGPVINEELNSSFSVLLAVILSISLFILSNKIFADVKLLADGNITKLLMIQGFFVIPFIMVAFLLNVSLKDEGERYKIISTPYFIVSGFLLLRLLFKVAGHILDKNAALGVYIVLGMVIVVLTGVVLFVSNYVKKK